MHKSLSVRGTYNITSLQDGRCKSGVSLITFTCTQDIKLIRVTGNQMMHLHAQRSSVCMQPIGDQGRFEANVS